MLPPILPSKTQRLLRTLTIGVAGALLAALGLLTVAWIQRDLLGVQSWRWWGRDQVWMIPLGYLMVFAPLAVLLALLHLLAPRPGREWDERAGELSYGLFLLHFLVFWMWPGADGGALALALRVAAALALAWLLHRLVEAPILAWRRRLRRGGDRRSRSLP